MANPIALRHRKIASYSSGLILDVGYADHPNRYLKGNVWGLDLIGIKLPKNYLKVIKGDAMSASKHFKPKFFDTVILAEIIEHMENPAGLLREVRKILKDKGRLIISTPNPYHLPTIIVNAFFVRPPKTAHKSHDPYHINLFPYRNMVTLLEHCDFNLEKVISGNGLILNPKVDRGPMIPFFKAFSQDYIYIVRKSTS